MRERFPKSRVSEIAPTLVSLAYHQGGSPSAQISLWGGSALRAGVWARPLPSREATHDCF